jgi:hypothetical protein
MRISLRRSRDVARKGESARVRAAHELAALRAQTERHAKPIEHNEPGSLADDLRYTIGYQGPTP